MKPNLHNALALFSTAKRTLRSRLYRFLCPLRFEDPYFLIHAIQDAQAASTPSERLFPPPDPDHEKPTHA